MNTSNVQSDVLVVGGGLAGLVTAIECLRAGQRVTLVDRDTPQRLGGLALWAFGGMALVDTPLQRRMKLKKYIFRYWWCTTNRMNARIARSRSHLN